MRDASVSEDIVQESYLRLLNFAAKPDGQISNEPALLRRISLNLIHDHFRNKTRAAAIELDESIPCQNASVDLLLEQREMIALISSVIEMMPRQRREVFIRRRFLGHTAGEVAKEMHISVSAVSHSMARAMVDLHAAMRKFEVRGISA